MFDKTDLFVTEEEKIKVFDLFKQAQNTPVVMLFGKHDLSAGAWGEDTWMFWQKNTV